MSSVVPMASWPHSVWEDVRQGPAVAAFLRRCRSASTLATYEVQRGQFLQFCELLGVTGSACFTADVLSRWVMGRSLSRYKLSTIELGLNAIADWLPSRGVLHDRAVIHALSVAARQPSAVRRQKVPIMVSLLRLLVPHEPTFWREARDYAFWLLAWFGMFRGSELASLRWEDLSVREGKGLVVFVPASKTDQAGQGQYVFIQAAVHEGDSVICPLRALSRLADFAPAGSDLHGPVFAVHQNSERAVSKNTMLSRLHRALHDLGQPSELFGLHSFRSGGATAASLGGVPERLIKAHGRWVSDCVRIYTNALPVERWGVSGAMQGPG